MPRLYVTNRSTSTHSASSRSTSRFSAARRSVSGLSDRRLLSATAILVKNERLTTLEVLVHLHELEKRELYLRLGCSSMFDYCVSHLEYSRSAAGRRIHAARCIARFPEVYELVEKNALNLCTVCLIAPALTDSNKKELLARVCGKSQDQVESIIAGYRPPIAFRDRVKPVRAAVPATADSGTSKDLALRPSGNESPGESLGETSAGTNGTANLPRYNVEKQLLIQFLVSQGFMTKYQEARSLLSNKLAQVSFEKVFEVLLDDYLDRHSPAKKQERREKRAAAANVHPTQKPNTAARQIAHGEASNTDTKAGTEARNTARKKAGAIQGSSTPQLSRKKFDEQSRSGTLTRLNSSSDEKPSQTNGSKRHAGQSSAKKQSEKSRYIPARIRDAVFVRDNNRCTYVGTDGKRCESKHRLHIDHVVPFARGGTNALSNLRLLCAKHNKLEAKRVYGAAKIAAHCKRE